MSLVQCPQCSERIVEDRLSGHFRYQHDSPRTRCDHCEGPLNPDGSPSYSKRFCRGTCQTLNHRALTKARLALEELKEALGLTTHPSS